MLDACVAVPATGFPVSLLFPDVDPQVLAREDASDQPCDRPLALDGKCRDTARGHAEI